MDFIPEGVIKLQAVTERNQRKLLGCILTESHIEQKEGYVTVMIFNNPYRKENIDLVIRHTGEIYISDYYKEDTYPHEKLYTFQERIKK